MKYLITTILILAFFGVANAQNTLLLMNGKSLQINSKLTEFDEIYYVYKNFKGKQKRVEIDNVFSLIDKSGTEQILYNPNVNGDDFSVNEMRMYLFGERDARNEYVAPWFTVGSFVAGAGAPFLLGYYSPVVPAVVSAGIGLAPDDFFSIRNSSPHLSNDFYKEGYLDVVRNKRVKNSLIGGGCGVVFGIAAVLIMSK